MEFKTCKTCFLNLAWVLMLSVSFSVSSEAAMDSKQDQDASEVLLDTQIQDLVKTAKLVCKIHDRLHSLSESYLTQYVGQRHRPEWKILTTAFLRGFTVVNSSYYKMAYCLVVFMNLPQDEYWESGLDFFQHAQEIGALPVVQIGSVQADGSYVLEPVSPLAEK